jgi:spore coat polysaccharide biosynthesis protein SpsF
MIGCIIQTRMGSTRLPGKVLKKIDEKNSVLYYVISQLQYSKFIDQIVVATTTLKEDDEIVKFCIDHNVKYFRGDPVDVLDRHYQCAKKFSFSNIVRMPSDKPLLDPNLVDKVISIYNNGDSDYMTTFQPLTFPIGTEVEIFSFLALESAWKNAKLPSEREHVTPYFYNNPEIFKTFNLKNDFNNSNYGWVVDTQADLDFVREIVSRISKRPITMNIIIDLLKNYPHLIDINKNVNRQESVEKSIKEDARFLNQKK